MTALRSAVTAVALSAAPVCAFVPIQPIASSVKTSTLSMADASYAWGPSQNRLEGNQPISIATRLLFPQYSNSDWALSSPRRKLSSSTLTSLSFLSDDEFSNDQDEDDNMLTYLPYSTRDGDIPPLTRQVLTWLTTQYVDDAAISSCRDVSSLIHKEYKTTRVPVRLGDTLLVQDEAFSRILSFCALYRLPKEMTLLLLESKPVESSLSSLEWASYRSFFESGGWDKVTFPDGLGVGQLRKYYSRDDSFVNKNRNAPMTWRLTRRKKRAFRYAAAAVREAAQVDPPRKRPSREEFLESMERELFSFNKSNNIEFSLSRLFQDPQQFSSFFPTRRIGRMRRLGKLLFWTTPKRLGIVVVEAMKCTLGVTKRGLAAFFHLLKGVFVSGFWGEKY